jgi:hypothetical protein
MKGIEERIAAGIVILFVLGAACADRERRNPFDPGNPDTGGRPYVMTAVAEDGQASISWSTSGLDDLSGYTLVRTVLDGGQPGDSARFRLEPDETVFTDTGLANGTTYLYRFAFLFDGAPTWTNSDTVTPGSTAPWVLDGYAGAAIRLSPDGRDRAAIFSTSSVLSDMDVIESDRSAWVTDYFNRMVYHIDEDGGLIEQIELSGFPVSIAVDELRREIWVGLSDPPSLVRLQGESVTGSWSLDASAISLSVDLTNGELWACSSSGGWVMRLDLHGTHTAGGFSQPRDIVFDHGRREAWVVESGRLVRVNRDLETTFTLSGFTHPEGVSLDSERGIVWIADTGAGRLVKVSGDGEELASAGGFLEPFAAAVDPVRDECWVADSFAGEIARVSGAGEVLEKRGGFLNPFEIGVIP